VGLLWTCDQLVAETSTWQHATDRHPCLGGIRNRHLKRQKAADLRLTPRGHWDRSFGASETKKRATNIKGGQLFRDGEQQDGFHTSQWVSEGLGMTFRLAKWQEQEFFCSSKTPHWLRKRVSAIFSGCRRFSGVRRAEAWKLITHQHLVERLRMTAVISAFSHLQFLCVSRKFSLQRQEPAQGHLLKRTHSPDHGHAQKKDKSCSGWLLSQSSCRPPWRWKRYGPPNCCYMLTGINHGLT